MNEPENTNADFNRRDFIKGGSLATMMTMLGGVQLFAQATPDAKPEKKPYAGPKIKIAVIGLGTWGREILSELGRLEQAEVAVICDKYPGAFLKAAKNAPAAAKVEDYKAVLADKNIQAVVVATPTHQHREIVLAALEAGKHVYCEAPLATTIEDAKAIALAAQKSAGQIFQAGLQMRCDPQRHWLRPFIRSGALGKAAMARAQWHKKASWRQESGNEERAKALNWRLDKTTSLGLVGEIGIHQIDQAGWFFLNAQPVAVTGFGSNVFYKDGREVADTAQLIVEYPGGVRLVFDSTLASSFDADYEVYSGSDAAVMLRDNPTQAWMFKEGDSPMFGWEVYARKDSFQHETGIALVAGGSKQKNLAAGAAVQSAFPLPLLNYALEAFLINCIDTSKAVEEFKANFNSDDKTELANYLAANARPSGNEVSDTAAAVENVVRKAPKQDVGYAATVLAIKANEAVVTGKRIELTKEMFELT